MLQEKKASAAVCVSGKYLDNAKILCAEIAPSVKEFEETKVQMIKRIYPLFRAAALAVAKDGKYLKTIKSCPESMAIYLCLANTFRLGSMLENEKREVYLRGLAGKWYSFLTATDDEGTLINAKRLPSGIALPNTVSSRQHGGDTRVISVSVNKRTSDDLVVALKTFVAAVCSELRGDELDGAVAIIEAITANVMNNGYMPSINIVKSPIKAKAKAKPVKFQRETSLAETEPQFAQAV